jgi:hypothetical protein
VCVCVVISVGSFGVWWGLGCRWRRRRRVAVSIRSLGVAGLPGWRGDPTCAEDAAAMSPLCDDRGSGADSGRDRTRGFDPGDCAPLDRQPSVVFPETGNESVSPAVPAAGSDASIVHQPATGAWVFVMAPAVAGPLPSHTPPRTAPDGHAGPPAVDQRRSQLASHVRWRVQPKGVRRCSHRRRLRQGLRRNPPLLTRPAIR